MADALRFCAVALIFVLPLLLVFRRPIRTGSWPAFSMRVIAAWAVFTALAAAFVYWQTFTIEPDIEACIANDGFECYDSALLYLIAPVLAFIAAIEFLVFALLLRLIRPAR